MHEPTILKGVIEIVGGGLIGLSCAWELQRRGLNPIVYERDMARHSSASWAGAGMLGALAETFPTEQWRTRAQESARLYPQWLATLGGHIDYVPGGEGLDGSVDPRDLIRELSSRLTIIERNIEHLDHLTGEQIVISTGAWASNFKALPPAEPVKGYLIAWDALPPGTIPHILRQGHTYILQRRSGRIIAGSTEQRIGFDDSDDMELIESLKQSAFELFPPLKTTPIAEFWHGFRPAAAGDVPVVERWNSRIVLAYGHYRNGILLAPWTASWVADEVQRQLGK